jgi:HD-GYP domain-containing protein (c-di-GMP phosphodiesterase class II)
MNEPVRRLLRLVQHQVHVGRPLPFAIRDAEGTLLLARGQVVGDDVHLAVLLDRGVFADAEEVRAAEAAAPPKGPARPLTLFDAWEQMIWRVERMLNSHEEPGFPQRLDGVVGDLLTLLRREPDIGIYLAMRQDARRLSIYGLTHSLYTAMACALAAARLGWSEGETRRIVGAAMTMNLTILALQGRLATQGNRPTEPQFERLRAHPDAAASALEQAGVADVALLDAVRQHHERRDGSGYPTGRRDPDALATALRHADVLLAKVSPRAGRAPMPIQQAHRELFADDGGGPFAAALIKEFGIFPPGDFVQLKSGEMAVVVRRGSTATTPEVAAITDRHGVPVTTSLRRDTARPEYAITGPAADSKLVLRLQPERLFGLAT